MSVLIKGMEMPAYCEECRLWVDRWCYATEERGYQEGMVRNKPDWCPLVEIPPHGRLIDADELDRRIEEKGCIWAEEYAEWASVCLEDAPTVIEAEGSE